jgi:hypothetical protein
LITIWKTFEIHICSWWWCVCECWHSLSDCLNRTLCRIDNDGFFDAWLIPFGGVVDNKAVAADIDSSDKYLSELYSSLSSNLNKK